MNLHPIGIIPCQLEIASLSVAIKRLFSYYYSCIVLEENQITSK